MEPKKPQPLQLNTEQQLLALRSLTQQTGILHEAQVHQIKLWPFAVDPTLTANEAAVDLENKAVTYQWKRPGAPPLPTDKRYFARLQKLAEAVAFLLGPDWRLTVAINGVQIFPSLYDLPGKKKYARRKPARKKPAGRPKRRR